MLTRDDRARLRSEVDRRMREELADPAGFRWDAVERETAVVIASRGDGRTEGIPRQKHKAKRGLARCPICGAAAGRRKRCPNCGLEDRSTPVSVQGFRRGDVVVRGGFTFEIEVGDEATIAEASRILDENEEDAGL